jgi:predicted AAA+ superfamily ATPase
LDEFQRCPELASYLQGLVDRDPRPGRWILTGSQNLGLLSAVSQSLAGRTGLLDLLPLTWREATRFEAHPRTLAAALFTGGYPRILDQGLPPAEWLSAYAATYVERDVRQLLNIGDVVAFQRFLELCAGRTAQLLNLSALAADAGISQPTAKAWLSVLEASFLVFRLPAFHANLRKRLVKMPKLHFIDSGLACWLLGIRDASQLNTHPLRGAIFESWVASEVRKLRLLAGESRGLSYYRDQHGSEADLVVEAPSGLLVVEAKAGSTASADMLASAQRVAGILAQGMSATREVTPMVVYGGETAQQRSRGMIVPWSRLADRDWLA